MTRVLVTGATGFIGGHLVEALAAHGERVVCLVRRPLPIESAPRSKVEQVRGDITSLEAVRAAVRGVDVVYHVAGLLAAPRRQQLMRVNRDGVANVARACAEQETPPVHVLVSSIAAAGPAIGGRPRRESDPAAPVSYYGQSKRAGELAAGLWAERVPTTIVRPGIVFGQRDPNLLPILTTLQRMRVHVLAGTTWPKLSFIHVHDLVELLLRAAQRGTRLPANPQAEPGVGVYFACAPEQPDYAEFGRLLRPLVGRPRALMLAFPFPVPWLVAGASEVAARLRGRMEMFNVDKIREASVTSWACSPEAARRELGFQPAASLVDRLQSTVAWYQQHGWL